MSKSEIRNLFFAPVSSGNLFLNFQKTILNGINVKEVKTEVNNIFNNSDRVKLWGIRDAKKTTFLKTKQGDTVCFYKEGKIIGYGSVLKTFIGSELSRELWGDFENHLTNEKYLWQNIIWLKDFNQCNIDFSVFIKYANYSEKFSIRGYLMFNDIGRSNILGEFNSFTDFFKKYHQKILA